MPASRALRIYSRLKIVPTDWKRIRERSREVMAVLDHYGPLEQMSVDEAYLDLSVQEDPVSVAAAIKKDVKERTSLPCSVGLATSTLVAKVASDHDKPDGFSVVRPGTEAAFLAPKSTRAILGIGPRTAERLAALEIHTCGQLAAARPNQIRAALGNQAAAFIQRAQGIDNREVHSEARQAKSISQEITVSRDVIDAKLLEAQLREMCASLANSLRKKGLGAHTVTINIRLADFTTITRQKSYEVAFDGENELMRRATKICRENWKPGQFIRLLGIGVSNLEVLQVRQLQLPLE